MTTEEPNLEGPHPDHSVAAAGRALVLLFVAVVLGVVVLQALDNGTSNRAQQVKTTTSRPKGGRTTTTTTKAVLRPPAQVIVVALNGAGVKGVGATVTSQLKKVQYNVLSPDNTKAPVKASSVYYTAGYEGEAREVAKTLGLAASSVAALPTPAPSTNIRTANVVVVVGPDLIKK